MKIKLSKSQWEFMGRKAGWMKTDHESLSRKGSTNNDSQEIKNKVCNDCKKRPVWGQYGEFSRCKECYDKQVDAGERASLDK